MLLGSSGMCIENCGDGKNYGINQCDDGNLIDGDGCSSSCLIEEGWMCYGGSLTTADICSHELTTFKSLNVTEENNLILKFSNPIFIVDKLTEDDIDV